MIIYNVIEKYFDGSSNFTSVHSSYYTKEDAEKIYDKLNKDLEKLYKSNHRYSIEESCLHESSEVPDLLKQKN